MKNEVAQPIAGMFLQARLNKYAAKHEQAMNDVADWYYKTQSKKRCLLMYCAVNSLPITFMFLTITGIAIGFAIARL